MKSTRALVALLALVATACGQADDLQPGSTPSVGGAVTVYSGRERDLVEPLFAKFKQETGITVKARYGDSAELAAQIAEEGANSPADVFFSQDAGALGALAERGLLAELDEALLEKVPARFRSNQGRWVGISGRARVIVYNTREVLKSDVPADVFALTDPKWKGQVGWAPTNGSFQSFVTAMRLLEGDARTKRWLADMKANDAEAYAKNSAIAEAVGAGEIQLGLVNHYYLLSLKKENPRLAAENYFLAGGPGSLVNVAGVGITRSTKNSVAAARFVEYLLGQEGQRFFSTSTFEYPLVAGIPADTRLPSLSSLKPPDLDLSNLSSLEATLKMLRDVGLL